MPEFSDDYNCIMRCDLSAGTQRYCTAIAGSWTTAPAQLTDDRRVAPPKRSFVISGIDSGIVGYGGPDMLRTPVVYFIFTLCVRPPPILSAWRAEATDRFVHEGSVGTNSWYFEACTHFNSFDAEVVLTASANALREWQKISLGHGV